MRRVRLSVKLMGGFGFVCLVTLLVGVAGWISASNLGSQLQSMATDSLPGIQNVLTMREKLESMRVATRTLLNPYLTAEDRKRQFENIAAARQRCKKAMDELSAATHDSEEAALWKQLEPALAAFQQETDKFLALAGDLERTGVLNPLALKSDLERFRGDHYKVLDQTSYLLHTHKLFDGAEDHSACNFGKWLAGYHTDNAKIAALLRTIAPVHATFHQSVKKIKDAVRAGDVEGAARLYGDEMVPAAEKTFGLFGELHDQVAQASDLYGKMNEQAMVAVYAKQRQGLDLLQKYVTKQEADADAAKKAAADTMTRTRYIVGFGMLFGVAAAMLLGFLTSLAVTRPLKRVMQGLTDGSQQVAAASGEVSNASQQLAEGASQQAAAVEETSSSLEELSSMTRQNASNANQANQLMKEVHQIIAQAGASMSDLNTSMQAISKASLETQKIIKTIDEIAFQTNLLALNAAVEAARAGEAGAGFAVVADEVRNLAMRAAEAAKNTADLIEGTVTEVQAGSGVVDKTNKEFEQLVSGVSRAGELVGEITVASSEQAQGIEQINRAVTEMDKVIQQNAANAEESASASEELNAQAEQLRSYVADLAGLVGQYRDGAATSGRRGMFPDAEPGGALAALPRPSVPLPRPKAQRLLGPAKGVREIGPEQVIPLGREGFSEF